MSEMQGCQLKQIKRSPTLCSTHTRCAHRLITLCHTRAHKCTYWNAQSSHSKLSLFSGRCRKIWSNSVSLTVKYSEPAITNVFRGERKEESESRGEVEAGHVGEEVSHFPSCEAVWEWEPMRAGGVAATFWAERQVRAGGGAKRRPTCPLL